MLLVETRPTPKEALCKIIMESTSQGKSDSLKLLIIDWFWVAGTHNDEGAPFESILGPNLFNRQMLLPPNL
jgi:hypothetical protein